MVTIGQRFRAKTGLAVVCWWLNNTVAILDDYSEAADATLPEGAVFVVREIPDAEPDRILCTLETPKRFRREVLSQRFGLVTGFLKVLFCGAADFHLEIQRRTIEAHCELLVDHPKT